MLSLIDKRWQGIGNHDMSYNSNLRSKEMTDGNLKGWEVKGDVAKLAQSVVDKHMRALGVELHSKLGEIVKMNKCTKAGQVQRHEKECDRKGGMYNGTVKPIENDAVSVKDEDFKEFNAQRTFVEKRVRNIVMLLT